jgi:hypothetical protein
MFMVPCIIDYIINVQRYATTSSLYFILLQYPSTYFGCLLLPSSEVRKTVVTTTGPNLATSK